MNKFFKSLLIFFIPILFFFTVVELNLRNNTFKAKAKYIEENREEIEVMVLGSSQNWRAINPAYISSKIAPLAHGGSAINIDFLLFEKYVHLLPKLKVVIFEAGYHNLETRTKNSKWPKNHLFKIYYGIDNYKGNPPLKDYFLLSANFKEYFKKFITPLKTQKFGKFNQYGFITEYPTSEFHFESVEYDSLKVKNIAAKYIKKNRQLKFDKKEIYNRNTNKFKEIITQCLDNDISVVLLSPPKHYTYNNLMKDDVLKRRDDFLQIYKNMGNVYFWNFEKSYEYQSELFLNPDHCNPEGAKIFSTTIDSLLSDLINTNAQSSRRLTVK